MAYITYDGIEVTKDEIKGAFENSLARLVISYNYDGGLSTCLSIYGKDWDTRGECYQMAEESWTIAPLNLQECLDAANFPDDPEPIDPDELGFDREMD